MVTGCPATKRLKDDASAGLSAPRAGKRQSQTDMAMQSNAVQMVCLINSETNRKVLDKRIVQWQTTSQRRTKEKWPIEANG
jgi:hypothetical protein